MTFQVQHTQKEDLDNSESKLSIKKEIYEKGTKYNINVIRIIYNWKDMYLTGCTNASFLLYSI